MDVTDERLPHEALRLGLISNVNTTAEGVLDSAV